MQTTPNINQQCNVTETHTEMQRKTSFTRLSVSSKNAKNVKTHSYSSMLHGTKMQVGCSSSFCSGIVLTASTDLPHCASVTVAFHRI